MQLQLILATRERAAGALIDRPRSAGYFEIRRMSDYGTTAHGQSGCSYWAKRLISRPRIPRRIFTAVPGPEKLEAQSKFRRDRQGRVAGSQMAEQEVPQARSTPSAHLARSGSFCRKKPTPRRPGFAPSP